MPGTIDREEESIRDFRRARRFDGAGGTSGGLWSFILGFILSSAGAYLIMNQVQVTSGYWLWWGSSTFGLTLVPLILGVGILFFDGRSRIGWFLSAAGATIIFAGVLTNLQMFFRTTSLYNFLLMAVLFVGGLGLMARSLRGN